MVKKISTFLVISIMMVAFFGFVKPVKAYEPETTLYGNDVISRIDDSQTVLNSLIGTLTTWSNSHASSLKDIVDKNILDDISLEAVISKLSSEGYNQAATDLEGIKASVKSDIDYLNTTLDMIEYYINHDIEDDGVDDTDIYYKMRSVFRNSKESINNLIRIYYNLYYNEVQNKIDTFSSYSELNDLYDKYSNMVEGTMFSKFKQKLDRAKNFYISNNVEIYEPIIKDEFRGYYTTLKSDFDALYTKLENKLQQILDDRLNEIINPVDKTNVKQVIEANKKIYNIMDKINEVKADANDKITRVNNYFDGISAFATYASEYETKVIDRFTEAYEYAKSKLIKLDLLVTLKDERDKNIIKIDNENGIIIYDSSDLEPSTLINKLFVNYGEFTAVNTYSGKIGTKSSLSVYYETDLLKDFLVVVRGDISPDAKRDITDLVKLCDKMYGLVELDAIETLAADFDDNSTIDITDLVNLCDRIYE